MSISEYFDVLNINDHNENVDMIQSLLGAECLGTYLKNGGAKLYFNNGKKKDVEIILPEICAEFPFQWNWEKQKKEDWHLPWKDNFQPVVIDEKLAVIPDWQDDVPADIAIKIKPGMAFGTGHHETTWLMLRQMMKHIKSGMSVLDLGSGSGILSIAAIKLGAERVDAVENDTDCESNFYENLQLNQIKDDIHYHNHDVQTWKNSDYDIILANINRNVIEELIPNFKITNAIIILSGLLETDYEAIEQLCQIYNFKIDKKFKKGEWICIEIYSH